MLEGCTPRQGLDSTGLDSLDTSTASTSLDTGLDTWTCDTSPVSLDSLDRPRQPNLDKTLDKTLDRPSTLSSTASTPRQPGLSARQQRRSPAPAVLEPST